jgi:hypothetical protein
MKHWLDDDDLDYEDEQDPYSMVIVSYAGPEEPQNFYILEEEIDDRTHVIYKGYKHVLDNMWTSCKVLTEEEKKKYIYNNSSPIYIWEKMVFNLYYWSNLPKEIKDKL